VLLPLTRTTLIVVPFTLGTAAIACLRDASMIACWLGIAGTAPGRSPWPADGPRPLSTAGGRPQAALHGRRTAPGRSARPADGPRPLSTAGGWPQAALHGRRMAPGRSPRPADGPRPLSTAGGWPQTALHGRRTAPGRSPRPADGPRPLSTAGRRLQAALHSWRAAPRPLQTLQLIQSPSFSRLMLKNASGNCCRNRRSTQERESSPYFAGTCYDNSVKKTGSCVDHHQYVAS
jgi:hypothetical protein